MDEMQVTHGQYVQKSGASRDEPLLKVYLCGSFRLCWQVPSDGQEDLWDSRTSARSLFKLLLCMPERQAAKSLLAGILWPETDEEKALSSLRSAVKVLRKVLCSADGETLIEQPASGNMLRLAGQQRLWVDIDAFEFCVAGASRATTNDEALTLWQEARTLMQGELLAEDQHYEWYGSRPVKLRRQTLWMARSRMIWHLADLYIEHGKITLAEEELEQHIARFPTDQDALYRLLTLLEQHSCFEQATNLYIRMKRMLEATGKQPAKHVRAVYERIQQTIIALQQTPPPPSIEPFRSMITSPRPLLAATQVVSEQIVNTSGSDLRGSNSAASFSFATDESFHDVIGMLQAITQREGMPEISQLAHRQLLQLNIASCITRLAQLDNTRFSPVEREELSKALGESIADSWKLFLYLDNTQLLALGRVQLALLHQAHTFIYPSTLPYLYSGVYGLIGIGLHFQEHDEEALHAYHNGYIAAQATGNPWYIAQNLICQADTCMTLGRYDETLQILEEAISHLGDMDEEHRRAKAHIFACRADLHMGMGQYTEAHKKLDASMSYLNGMILTEEFDHSCWLQLAGKNALIAGKFEQAISLLEEALTTTPNQWLARQLGILIPLAMAYARIQEREQSLLTAQKALPVIKAVNAPMTNNYFLEYVKGDMLGRFSHNQEIQTFLTDVLIQLPQFTSSLERHRSGKFLNQ